MRGSCRLLLKYPLSYNVGGVNFFETFIHLPWSTWEPYAPVSSYVPVPYARSPLLSADVTTISTLAQPLSLSLPASICSRIASLPWTAFVLGGIGYYDNYLVDNRSCVIVGVQATAARMSQETVAAQDMIARFAQWQGHEHESAAADATYGNGEFLQWLMERGITPYMRTRDNALRKNNPLYGPDRFTYPPESNRYRCPAGEQLTFVSLNVRNRTHA
jgi:hypothetical protein